MNTIKRSFLLIFSLIIFSSCNKKDDETIPVANEGPYELASIEWSLQEGDGQEIVAVKLPEQHFENQGNDPLPVVVRPLEELQGTSQFFMNDSALITDLTDANVMVNAPDLVEILSDSYGYVVGGQLVPFRPGESSFDFSTSIKDSTTLAPGTQISYQMTIYLKKITATYFARFDQGGAYTPKEMKGKWTGVFYQSMESEAVYKEID